MKISYKGIGSDLKNILFKEFEKNEDTLFVFENSASFFEIKREFLQNEEIQQKLGIFQNFKMMNSYDFYENVFVTDKIVVKEEKQVVLFYNALTEKLKKDMKMLPIIITIYLQNCRNTRLIWKKLSSRNGKLKLLELCLRLIMR